MAERSNIEWCDHTFNPWEGCQKVGPGCDHCYAETRNARFNHGQAVNWGPGAPRRRTGKANWKKPEQWQKQAAEFMAQHGRRQRVFCASLADVFDNQVPTEWRDDLWSLIQATPDLDWLLLTKRIGNVPNMLALPFDFAEQFPHVWIGATITSQEEADRDIPKLLQVDARVHFLSMEPLLGPVFIEDIPDPAGGVCLKPLAGLRWVGDGQGRCRVQSLGARIDWVIVGGESGYGARPTHPEWARNLASQCAASGTPFLFKQWGGWIPADQSAAARAANGYAPIQEFEHLDGHRMHRIGKKAAGRLLDGVEHNGFPESSP